MSTEPSTYKPGVLVCSREAAAGSHKIDGCHERRRGAWGGDTIPRRTATTEAVDRGCDVCPAGGMSLHADLLGRRPRRAHQLRLVRTCAPTDL
jgi:hypothetical protein